MEHFFEHLTTDQADSFLKECLRILKPTGALRLSVPDGQLYLEKYLNDRTWMLERRDGAFNAPMDVVNAVFRQRYEHQYCYDAETLEARVAASGFKGVVRADFGEGRTPELLIDQAERRFESLYVEASKAA